MADGDSSYGDFTEVKEEEKKPEATGKPGSTSGAPEYAGPVRVRMPRGTELIGIVVQRLGGNKMEIRATDGKTRNSRVPGRFKRRFWLRPGDFVIIVPWETDETKADIIFQYRGGQVNQLRKKGLLDGLQEGF